MGDNNSNDNDGQDQDDPKGLRAQLTAEQEKNRKLAASNAAYEQREKLSDLGFGHLNKRQQQTLIRDLAEEGKDLDETNVAAIATEYGWPTEAPKPPRNQGGQNGDGNGDGQNDSDDGELGDGIDDSLSAIGLMQRAGRLSASTEVKSTFENEMRATKSKEELRDLIRTKGPRHGIVHEWDVP